MAAWMPKFQPGRTAILLTLGVAAVPAASRAQSTVIDFTGLTSGQSVEGPGKVNPLLDISTSKGSAIAIFNGQKVPLGTNVYQATGPGNTAISQGYVGPLGGIADQNASGSSAVAGGLDDFTFTFAPGTAVNKFSITMLDEGDNDPHLATNGTVTWTGYDSAGVAVATDKISYTVDITKFSAGTDSAGGSFQGVFINPSISADASAPAGKLGNYTFTLIAPDNDPNMVKIAVTYTNDGTAPSTYTAGGQTLTAAANPAQPLDPKLGYTALTFNFVKVPEPASTGLLAAGAGLLALIRRRRR